MNTSLDEFKKALEALKIAIDSPKTDLNRDATIQRFEFCVELATKSAKKVLALSSVSPRTIIREMAQEGLIDDPEKWLNYVELRNLSSHTYKEDIAVKVHSSIPNFFQDAKILLKKLEEKNS